MATAYINKNTGMTEIRNSEGFLVKEIETDPTQVKQERKTCLWKPEPVAVLNGQNLKPFNKRNGV